MPTHPISRLIWLISIVTLLFGCSTLSRNPVPIEKIPQAEIPGYTGIRTWAGEYSQAFQDDLILSIKQESDKDFPRNAQGYKQYNVLILSGGGENGAFGAGVMYGWSKSGKRPRFKAVTGISTGAVIGCFALLGSKYDESLRQVYTGIKPEDIYVKKSILAMFSDESLTDSAPLRRLVKKYINEAMINDIAKAYYRGQRFYVGTTHMDADRLYIWNMGKIAASKHKDRVDLFQDIVIASASIPGIFSPVYVDVAVDGKLYDEMHVDGGLKTQMIFYGVTLDMPKLHKTLKVDRSVDKYNNIYIIRNGKFDPYPEHVTRNFESIMTRSVSSLTKSTAYGDLYRIYSFAKRDGVGFNYIGIPATYKWVSKEEFDPLEMNALFDLGYNMAIDGIKWRKSPPGFEP